MTKTQSAAAVSGIVIGTTITLLGYFGNRSEMIFSGLFLLTAGYARLMHLRPPQISTAEDASKQTEPDQKEMS